MRARAADGRIRCGSGPLQRLWFVVCEVVRLLTRQTE
jgi:hypothetical protein